MSNVIVWADIPVLDLDRAREFYSHVLGTPVQVMPEIDGVALLMPPGTGSPDDVSADLVLNAGIPSTTQGTTIYLDSQGDIHAMLKRVVEAGGTVLDEPANMGEMVGWLAFFADTEGNRIGIHQNV